MVLVAGVGGGKSTLLDAWVAARGAVLVDLAVQGLDAVPAEGLTAIDGATARDVSALANRRGVVIAAEQDPGVAGAVVVTAAELAFAEDETYQVLAAAFGDAEAADVLAPDLHLLTNGWPGLVALAAAWLAQHPAGERRERLTALARAEEGLAEFLVPAVLGGLSADEREVVRRAVYAPAIEDSRAVPPFVQGLLRRPGWFVVPAGWKAALRSLLPRGAAETRYFAGM
ncbi:hypothetical protein [Dactylosporangium sp. CS-033363]|uniref:hypothetical protein n=1 Tax=Dactylosporangium sp. CS-033363 TaxID=3239935 RepID=UPI003D8B58DE